MSEQIGRFSTMVFAFSRNSECASIGELQWVTRKRVQFNVTCFFVKRSSYGLLIAGVFNSLIYCYKFQFNWFRSYYVISEVNCVYNKILVYFEVCFFVLNVHSAKFVLIHFYCSIVTGILTVIIFLHVLHKSCNFKFQMSNFFLF